MSITITNVSPAYLPDNALQTYVVNIGSRVVARFEHKRNLGLVSCILHAAAAVLRAGPDGNDPFPAAPPPGTMFWDWHDPEAPLEDWDEPVSEHWMNHGCVYKIQQAFLLPEIWVTDAVLSVDEFGDPDETEPVWFRTEAEAEGHFERSLNLARLYSEVEK